MSATNESVSHSTTVHHLLVDDDVEMLTLCAGKLEAHGFSVLKAIGSAEADRLCAEHPAKIDLILIDVMLYPPRFSWTITKMARPECAGIS